MRRKVIQVPVDQELLDALDSAARREGRSRAEFIRNACRVQLHRLEEEELERAYVEGYRRMPEDPGFGQAQLAMLAEVLPPEEW